MIQGYLDYLLVHCGMSHDPGILEQKWKEEKPQSWQYSELKSTCNPKKYTFLSEARVPEYYHLIIPVVQ